MSSAGRSAHLQALVARGAVREKAFERGLLSPSLGWSVRAGRHLVSDRTQTQLRADIEQDVRTGSGCLLIGTLAGPLLLVAGYLLVG